MYCFPLYLQVDTTADERVDDPDGSWTVRPVSPDGDGWHALESFSDRYTVWCRLVVTTPSEEQVP